MLIQSCRNSLFQDLRIIGVWPRNVSREVGGIDSTPYQVALQLDALSSAVTCKNNKFINVDFENFDYAIISKYDISNNIWEGCHFTNLGYGVVFGEGTILSVSGQFTGPVHNTFKNCEYRDIDRNGILVVNGTSNTSSGNKFFSVGNDGGLESNASYSVIQYDKPGNTSFGDYFSRTSDLGYNQTFINNHVYVPEISGHAIYENGYTNRLRVVSYSTAQRVFRLPADTKKSFEIDYLYVSNQVDAMRQGKLEITVNPTGAGQLLVVDDYDFIGDVGFETNLQLSAQISDENLDGTLDTLAVNMLNSTTSDDADFYYTIKTKV